MPRPRSAAPVKTTLWLESKMGHQQLARQVESHGVPRRAVVISEVCHRLRRIDERDITRSESHRLVVVGHRWLAPDLKDGEIVVDAVEASIPAGPLDPLSIATDIQRRE